MMSNQESVLGLSEKISQSVICEKFSLAKNHKIPHSSTQPRVSCLFENVHVDLSGIIRIKGLKNEMYYVLFCDDYSTYCHISFMKDKTKETVFEIFKAHIALSERQTCNMLKRFTLDRGSEL